MHEMEVIMPAFSTNNVPVVFSCSNLFVPHVTVAIQSLIKHSTKNHNYDLMILHCGITEQNQQIMKTMLNGFLNISLRFFNVEEYIRPANLHVYSFYSVETYYRLLIPQLLYTYKKVVYLDSDVTILRDIADLFETEIGDNLLGASLDLEVTCRYSIEPNVKEYLEKILALDSPDSYFQAGVLIFNIYEFNKLFAPYELMEFAGKHAFTYVDQDVLNITCSGHVYTLSPKWDVIPDGDIWKITDSLKKGPQDIYVRYLQSTKDPFIIHHAGPTKPWNNPQIEYAEVYWKYARQTPFYEVTLYRMMQNIYAPLPATQPYRSRARKLADKLLPKGSRRRNLAKKILPKGSKRWEFCKKIYYKIFKR